MTTTYKQHERKISARIADAKSELAKIIDEAAALKRSYQAALVGGDEKLAEQINRERGSGEQRADVLRDLLIGLDKELPREQLAEAKEALAAAEQATAKANESYAFACAREKSLRQELQRAEIETDDATRQKDVAHSREMGARRLVATMEAQNANP